MPGYTNRLYCDCVSSPSRRYWGYLVTDKWGHVIDRFLTFAEYRPSHYAECAAIGAAAKLVPAGKGSVVTDSRLAAAAVCYAAWPDGGYLKPNIRTQLPPDLAWIAEYVRANNISVLWVPRGENPAGLVIDGYRERIKKLTGGPRMRAFARLMGHKIGGEKLDWRTLMVHRLKRWHGTLVSRAKRLARKLTSKAQSWITSRP